MVQWISVMRASNFFSPNYSLFKAYSCIWYKILGTDWVSSVMVSTFYMGWLVNYQYNYSISLLRSAINTAAIVHNSNEYVWILWYTSFLPNIWATFFPTKQKKLLIKRPISICLKSVHRLWVIFLIFVFGRGFKATFHTPPSHTYVHLSH